MKSQILLERKKYVTDEETRIRLDSGNTGSMGTNRANLQSNEL